MPAPDQASGRVSEPASSPESLDITGLKGVGPKTASMLARLGIKTIRDALYHLPSRYEDRSRFANIIDASAGSVMTFSGTVVSAEVRDLSKGGVQVTDPSRMRARKRGRGALLFELIITDGTGFISGKWFNQPFLRTRFKKGYKVILSGEVRHSRWPPFREIQNPAYEITALSDATAEPDDSGLIHAGRAVPVYPTTEGLSPRHIRSIIASAVEGYASSVSDAIPEDICLRLGFPPIAEAVRSAHFPPEGSDIDAYNQWASPAQQRLAFSEFFMLEAGLALLRQGATRERGISFKPRGELEAGLRRSLPYSLTKAQERVLGDIFTDMAAPYPMHRLLQGDVGSGKTVVALMAMLRAVDCGYQAALMAPTEILAEQHAANIRRMVEPLGLDVALLTGSTRNRPSGEIASGEAKIIVGTHALVQEGVSFGRLGLAVIDEQHRFGVMQRAVLRKKAQSPDMLIMTATPIPRTLSLTLYGDLDYSVIDELPPGRTPVLTTAHTPDSKHEAYEALEKEIAGGGQAYVVYPLIEESEQADLKSAARGYEAFTKRYPSMRVGLIHGRLRPAEKDAVMRGFQAGEIDILVSTTVIEVGVDVPNASLMVVVNAERFGLAQLHQLRGRVGRGRRASRCMLLLSGPLGEDASGRIEAMCSTNDGFRIAEADLSLRGPGELMGTRQSGMPELKVANLLRDARVLELARREAFTLVESDPALDAHPGLRAALEEHWRGKVELFGTG